MCPGIMNHGCKYKSQAALGRIYCADCQAKVTANGAAVQRSHQKQAERSKGIRVAEPFFTQLSRLSTVAIKAQLPSSSIAKLNIESVGVDTSAANRSVESKYMYSLGAAYLDSHGQRVTFWANRHGSDDGWLSATWNIRIDNILVSSSVEIFEMLNQLALFCRGRQIIFYTGSNGCDYKRLTSAYKFRPDLVSPFPPERHWLNVGQDITRHIIDHNGIIKSPNWKLPTINAYLYQVCDKSGRVLVSCSAPSNYLSTEGIPETNPIRDAIWALNVFNFFKNRFQ